MNGSGTNRGIEEVYHSERLKVLLRLTPFSDYFIVGITLHLAAVMRKSPTAQKHPEFHRSLHLSDLISSRSMLGPSRVPIRARDPPQTTPTTSHRRLYHHVPGREFKCRRVTDCSTGVWWRHCGADRGRTAGDRDDFLNGSGILQYQETAD